MKKLYTYLGVLACFLMTTIAYSQEVIIVEDFDDPTVPTGWSTLGFLPTEVDACENGSLRRNFNEEDALTGTLSTPGFEASGSDIIVSFDYKIIDVATGDATDPTDVGTMKLQYSIDGGATWVTPPYATITAGVDVCTTHTATILGTDVPAGSEFAWRLNGVAPADNGDEVVDYDYYFYIDNFSAIEQVDCIQPVMITIDPDSITMDSAEISWTELGDATSWIITYSLLPLYSSAAPPVGDQITVTTNPYTLTGLEDGETYYVWIQADCGADGESSYEETVPDVSFNTVAIGSDCENPLEVTALPFSHADQDTGDYGDDYEGAAGISCGATGDYLNGFETVYHFVPATDDILQINLSELSVGFSGVFVYTSCDDVGNEAAACFGASTSDTTADHGIEDLFVTAGEDYYIVVSSFPGAGADETLEYTLDIIGFDCATFEEPIAATPQTYVTGQTLFDLDVDPTIEGATFTWYSDAALTTEIPDTTVLVDGTTYYVTQTIGDCESAATAVTVDEFDCLTGLDIISTTEGPGACDSGTVDLEATANINANIYWWDAETDGDIVGIGPNFTTPELDVTTSYWVSEAFLGEGIVSGQASPGPVAISSSTSTDYGVDFHLDSEITLVDLTVYSTGAAGAILINIASEDGTTYNQNFSKALPAGSIDSPTPMVIEIDAVLPGNTSYSMTKLSGDVSLAYDSDASYPYNIGISGEVLNGISWGPTTSEYYYFFNWTIIEDRPLCESPREEVVATVHEIIPIELSVLDPTVCIGSSTDLTVTTTNTNYTYELTWNNGTESDTNFDAAGTIVITPAQNTTYTVIATDTETTCMTENEIFVEVIGVPTDFPMAPGTTTVVCAGESTMFVAGGIGENFEGDTEWTTQNNSTSDDDPEAAAWSIQQSPYLDAGIVSNDNSQFYFSHADILGAGGTVDAELTSPSFSLVSVDEASVSFEHYYRHHPSTVGDVEISIDGGSTWVPLVSYTTTQGAADDFKSVKIDLEEYLGNADVQIRFWYHGGWGWWWAVDNVTIVRDYIGDVTWSPQAGLFLDAQATIAYDGTGDAPSIYYNAADAGTTTYTATLVVADCGSTVGTIEVTAQFTDAPVAAAAQTFDEGALVSDIVATGENLIWYADETGQLIIPETTILENGVTYYVSQTVSGCESVLVPVTVTVVSPSENCPEPVALTIVEVTATSALISWEEPEDTEGVVEVYYYRVKEIGGDPELVFQGEILVGTSIIEITGLKPEKDYTFEMYSVCDEENAVYSDLSGPEDFHTGPLGINEINFTNLDYYPNPTSDILTISNNISIDRVEVYDISGKRILDKKAGMFQLKIDFSEFSSGMYLTKITAGEATKIIRIIKK